LGVEARGLNVTAAICRVNALRAAQQHLEAQVEAGLDTPHATLQEAREELARIDAELRDWKRELRDEPDAAYLWRRRRSRYVGRR
jgi:hypothetical protein